MHTQTVKESLHHMIDQIEDRELLLHYQQLLKVELNKRPSSDFFEKDEAAMVDRAKAALESIEAGKSRSIEAFKKDVEAWKNSAM